MVLVIYHVNKTYIGSKTASHKTGSTRRKHFKGRIHLNAGCCRSYSPKMPIALTCCLQQQFTYHPLLSWPVNVRSEWKHILAFTIDLVWDSDHCCKRLRQTKKNRAPLTCNCYLANCWIANICNLFDCGQNSVLLTCSWPHLSLFKY